MIAESDGNMDRYFGFMRVWVKDGTNRRRLTQHNQSAKNRSDNFFHNPLPKKSYILPIIYIYYLFGKNGFSKISDKVIMQGLWEFMDVNYLGSDK